VPDRPRPPRPWPAAPALLLTAALCACGGKDSDTADTGGAALCPALSPALSPVAGVDYPRDDTLRLHHAQALGTHNSYHVEPEGNVIPDWEYTHAPLDVQLGEQGVRQFELDLHLNPDSGALEVFHVPYVDAETTCLSFADCLCTLRQWSDRSPAHLPILVALEPKDDLDEVPLSGNLDLIDETIRSVWPEDRLFTPDDLQGGAASLEDALADDGWPTLGEVRGQAIFYLLDSGTHRDEYTDGQTSLAGRALFANVGVGHPLSAITQVDDPFDAGSIQAALDANMLVRTRSDAGGDEVEANDTTRLEAAVASGAHFISTDYPAPVEGVEYVAAIPGGQPAGCNPVTAPADCEPADIEDPSLISE
jgi:hypothetical protein